MKQQTLSDMEYNCRKKKTKREEFLEIMDEIIPWDEWVGIIRPYYPTGSQRAYHERRNNRGRHNHRRAQLHQERGKEAGPGGSGYLGIEKREEVANDQHLSAVDYRINLRPGRFPKVSDNAIDWTCWIEKRKSSVRCKVEYIFRMIKCQFGYRKVRYRGLKKSEDRLYAMFACANLYVLAMAGRKLQET